MHKYCLAVIFAVCLGACNHTVSVPSHIVEYPTYKEALANWKSYQDVADWLKYFFKFSKYRQFKGKNQQPDSIYLPKNLYKNKSGWCLDGAYFSQMTLARINPDYRPGLIFISNNSSKYNHWVTGFYIDDDLYVMDYSTGSDWTAMQGVHGPYKSLDEYRDFLLSLSIPGFSAGPVYWNSVPGLYPFD